jgi:hypothetical protein
LCDLGETNFHQHRFYCYYENEPSFRILRQQAKALRDLGRRSPKIAEALRRLADQLDAMADEVDGGMTGPAES